MSFRSSRESSSSRRSSSSKGPPLNTHSEYYISTESSSNNETSLEFNESIDLNDTLDLAPSVNELFTPPAQTRRKSYTNQDDDGDDIINQIGSDWDVGVSPIMKNRESDGGGAVLLMSSADDPTKTAPLQFAIDKGLVEYASPHGNMANNEMKKQESESSKSNQEFDQDEDISSLRRQVGMSSSNFLEKVTEAARRRKFEMTRSRDSLVAKEEEQRRSRIATEEKARREAKNSSVSEADSFSEKSSDGLSTSFKARPVPSTTGSKGTGGLKGVPKVAKRPTTTPMSPLLGARRAQKGEAGVLKQHGTKSSGIPPKQDKVDTRKSSDVDLSVSFSAKGMGGGVHGVPKVAKRPTTTPMSPLLGARRPQKPKVEALQPPREASVGKRTNSIGNKAKAATKKTTEMKAAISFHARPLPVSLGTKGRGGLAGVPKVSKRPLTIPRSPCLGPRRRAKSVDVAKTRDRKSNSDKSKQNEPLAMSICRSNSMSSLFSAPKDDENRTTSLESPILFGLKLLSQTPEHNNGKIQSNDENVSPQTSAFELHSTRRAKKRAQYNVSRDDNLKSRTIQAKIDREKQIKHMERELKVLRGAL